MSLRKLLIYTYITYTYITYLYVNAHIGRRYFSKFKLGVDYTCISNANFTLYCTIKNILNE